MLFLLLHLTMQSAAAQDTAVERGALTASSAPSGLMVYVDDTPIGTTPIVEYGVTAGRHTIRVANPNPTEWDMRDWVREITVAPGETASVHAVFVGVVTVMSAPFDAEVYVDGVLAGTTPVRLRDLAPGVHTLSIQKRGYERVTLPVSVSDTTRQTLKVDLKSMGETLRLAALQSGRENGHRLRKVLGYATLGTGIVFSGLAYVARHRANEAYERYQQTGDPLELERFYRQANRNDRIAGVFIGIAQVNFLASFYCFLSNAFHRSQTVTSDE